MGRLTKYGSVRHRLIRERRLRNLKKPRTVADVRTIKRIKRLKQSVREAILRKEEVKICQYTA